VQSLFKTEPLDLDGVAVNVREMSAAVVLSIRDKTHDEVALLLCKECVVEWSGETTESISANVPVRLIRKVADAVFRLSGFDEAKNSEPTPSAGSSTD
jgi:hypothetical protein